MSRKNLPKTKNTPRVKRERDPLPWRYCLLTLVCGLVLVGGFFFAARQHFSSIDFGIKNSQLKKQKDELEAAKRQLLLAKEIALSPAEIKKAAKKIGLTEMTAANIQAFYPIGETSSKTEEKPKPEKSPETKQTNINSTVTDKKTIEKKPEKAEKKTVESADSKTKKGFQQAKLIK